MLGLPTQSLYARTLRGIALWMGGPPLLARILGRAGSRDLLHRVQRWWAHGVTRSLEIRIDITGLEQIDRGESYVVTPLHEGFADALALLHLPLKLRFVARDELFTWRWLGPILRDTGQIEVFPEQGRRSYRQMLRATRSVFDAGESLVIFPQGAILGIEADFLPGSFALARAVRRPILPVALTGGHRVWEYPYTPRLRYGQRMSLRVLPPVPVEEVLAATEDDLRRRVQRDLKDAALSATIAPPRRFVPARDGYWDGYAYRIDPEFADLAAEIARHRRQGSSKPVQDSDALLPHAQDAG